MATKGLGLVLAWACLSSDHMTFVLIAVRHARLAGNTNALRV